MLLSPTRSVSREEARLFCGRGAPQNKALASLRQLILRIGQFDDASTPLAISNGDRLEAGLLPFSPTWRSSLRRRVQNVLAEQIAGLARVQGELLQNVELDGVDGELWLKKQRVLVADRYFSSFDRILDDLTRFGVGDASLIEEMFQNAIKIDADREETYRSVISAFARLGKAKDAERVYAALKKSWSWTDAPQRRQH